MLYHQKSIFPVESNFAATNFRCYTVKVIIIIKSTVNITIITIINFDNGFKIISSFIVITSIVIIMTLNFNFIHLIKHVYFDLFFFIKFFIIIAYLN